MTAPLHVIFDCDGVLVDSELLSQEVEEEMARSLGVPLSAAEMGARYTGRTSKEQWHEISVEFGLTLPADFADRHFARAVAVYRQRLRPIAGVPEMLPRLGRPASVASNSNRRQLAVKLDITGLAPHFDGRTYCMEDVPRPKPAPDMYLLAATRAGVAPERCVVVEDTPTGTRAARAAGIPVLGFVGASHNGGDVAQALRVAGVAAVFDDMARLPDILAAL